MGRAPPALFIGGNMLAHCKTKPYEYVTEERKLYGIAEKISRSPKLAIDIETTSLDPHTGKIRTIQLCTSAGETWVIDLWKTGGPGSVLTALKDYKGVLLGQNLKFEQQYFLKNYDFEMDRIFDTMLAAGICGGGVKGTDYSLEGIVAKYLALRMDKEEQKSDWGRPELTKSQKDYAARDVQYLHETREKLVQKIKRMNLINTARIEFGAMLPVASMELNGFKLDKDKWTALAIKQERDLASNTKAVQEYLAATKQYDQGFLPLDDFEGMGGINLSSPKQVRDALNMIGERDGIPQLMAMTSTNAETLKLNSIYHPVISDLLRVRGLKKLVSSYGHDFLKWVNPVTGRIHASYYPLLATGRYANFDPNLQQIPRSAEYRDCFIAEDGKVLVIIDFSQIELRMAAEIAMDDAMIEIFRSGGDIHAATAQVMRGNKKGKPTKDDRQKAKAVNFSMVYGAGAQTIAVYAKTNYNVNMTVEQAEVYRNRYLRKYPDIAAWQRRQINKGQRCHSTRTPAGRIRFIHPDKYNEFLNSPIQGGCADGLKQALRLVYENLKGTSGKLVHMVHDEIVVECDKGEAEKVRKILEENMIAGMATFFKRVPVEVDGGIGPSWAEK